MVKEEALIELAHPEYWDKRYGSELKASEAGTEPTLDSFEWFRSFEQLRPFLENNLPPPSSGCHIIHLGCGNSVCKNLPVTGFFFRVKHQRGGRKADHSHISRP